MMPIAEEEGDEEARDEKKLGEHACYFFKSAKLNRISPF